MNSNTIILNLHPTPQETSTLLDTMATFNAAKNYVLTIAKKDNCFNKHKLSSQHYYELKNNFLLPAQLVISAIGTVVEDHRKNKHVIEYNKTDCVFYDKRVISYRGLSRANLATTIGRLPIKFEFSRYILWDSAPSQVGCAILFFDGKNFSLYSIVA